MNNNYNVVVIEKHIKHMFQLKMISIMSFVNKGHIIKVSFILNQNMVPERTVP